MTATELVLPRRTEIVQAKREPEDEAFWSVTTILRVLDKSDALVNWACGEQAERTVDQLATITARLTNEGRESAVEFVSKLRWWKDGLVSDSQLGTIAHELFNRYALDGARPAVTSDLHPDHASKGKTLDPRDVHTLTLMLDQFDRFLQEWQPDYDATEVVVYNPTYQYAGQCDGFLRFDGVPTIIDYKTSRKTWTKGGKLRGPYAEAGLQLAAYRFAEKAAWYRARRYESYSRRYYLLNETELAAAKPVPPVDAGAVIYITPERYGVYPTHCDGPQPDGSGMFDAFLYVLEAARWQVQRASHVVGNAAPAPHPIPALTDDPFAGLPTD